MATKNVREVELALQVSTSNASAIKDLRDDVAKLAKQSGDAAPEFNRLANELDKLAQEAAALDSLTKVAQNIDRAAEAQAQAATRARELTEQYNALKAATDAAAVEQQKAKDAYDAAKRAAADLGSDIKQLKNDYQGAQRDTAEYKDELKRLVNEHISATKSSRELNAEYDKTKAATSAARKAQNELSNDYRNAVASAGALSNRLTEQKVAYDELARATLGVSGAQVDLTTSGARVSAALQQIQQAANRLQQEEIDRAAAHRAAAQAAQDANEAAAVSAQANAAEYANFWTNALREQELAAEKAAQATREASEQAAVTAQANAAEYTNWWVNALRDQEIAADKAAQALREASEAAAISAQANAAEYTNWWKNALQDQEAAAAKATLELKEQNEAAAFNAKANAAEYANWWVNALREQEAAQLKTIDATKAQAQAATQAADVLKNAFGTVGAASVAELQAKIVATRQAIALLGTSGALAGKELQVAMKQGEQAIAGLERQIRAARGELTLADRASNLWNQSMGGMKVGTLLAAGAISSLFQKITETGRAFLDAVVNNERFVQSLNNIFKSSQTAASQVDFLRTSANKAGVAVNDIQQSFVKFSAAMNGANIPLAQSNALFSALTGAAGSLGLSTDAVNRALEALGQIASKGTVSMEELRQQLGDALPGALGLAAKGLGITEGEVIKLVSSGQLAARDFFPAFTEGLKTVSGEANSLSQNWARLTNAVNAFFVAIGDSGALSLLKVTLSAVTFLTKGLALAFVGAAESARLLLTTFATFTSEILAGNGLSGAMQKLEENVAASANRLDAFRARLYETSDAANAVTVSATNNEAAMAGMDQAAVGASKALLQLNIAVADETEKLAEASKLAEVNTATTKTLVDAQLSLAKSLGDASLALDVEIAAKQRLVEATQAELDARNSELALMQQTFEATALLLAQDGELDKSDQARLIALAAQIEKMAGVRDAILAKVEASKNDVEQARIEKQTLQDNSARVDELKAAYERAKEALALLQQQKSSGIATEQQVADATRNLANASAMYSDSLKDNTEKLSARQVQLKADNVVELASLQAKKDTLGAMIEVAKAMGNEKVARDLRIAQLKVDIEITKAKAAAMIAEADASIAVSKAELSRLEASGKITEVQRAQLEGSIKIAEAKKLEAAAILKGVDAINANIDALKKGKVATDEKKASVDGLTGSVGRATEAYTLYNGQLMKASDAIDLINTKYMQSSAYSQNQIALLDAETQAQERLNAAKQRAIDLENKRRNVDSEGFSLNTNGQRVTAGVQTEESLYNALKSRGVDDATARVKAKELKRQYELWAKGTSSGSTLGTFSSGELMKDSWLTKPFEQVIDKTANDAKTGAGAIGGTTSNTQNTTSGPAKTYNVQIGNRTVRTASDADAQALIGALKDAKLTA